MDSKPCLNECQFSDCRTYRYVLTHKWSESLPQKAIAWIGLNPSTADEEKLDPTLKRIKKFSVALGATAFHMVNLFAFRATDPKEMKRAKDPIGPENNRWIREICFGSAAVIACWGTNGKFKQRDKEVIALLSGLPILCFGVNEDRTPTHPLYLSGLSSPVLLPISVEASVEVTKPLRGHCENLRPTIDRYRDEVD